MAAPRSPSPNLHRKSTTSFAHSKENEKAAARPRSPAIQPSKGSKSFMAPTISAASKVAAPSPRKKVLQERNELVPPLPEPLELPAKAPAPEIGLKSKMGLASPEIHGGIKNRQTVAADADECPPPYDPKTNYLSPRPQFLHYRPNPRIENYVAIERDGKRLEDSFSSESDGDVTEVTNVSEEEDEPPSAATHADVPLVATTIHVAEPEPEPKPCRSPPPSKRSKLVPFLAIVAVGCVLFPLAGLRSEDLRLNDYIAVANMKLWSSDAIAYLTSTDSREVFVSSMNETSSAADEAVYSGFVYSHGDKIEQVVEEMLVDQYEVVEDGNPKNDAGDLNYVFEKAEAMDDADDEIENVAEVEFSAEEFDTEISDNDKTDIKEVAPQVSEIIENWQDFSNKDVEFRVDKFEMEVAENCASHIEEEVAGQEFETIGNHDEFGEVGLTEEDQISADRLSLPAMSSKAIIGLSSAVLLIFAVLAFLHVKRGKTPLVTKGSQARKKVGSVSRGQRLGRDEDPTRNLCQPEESSSLTHTYQTRSRSEEHDDDLRHETRLRRDSTASSMSYGSFTTYERLSAKKGSKDEEVVTPVRRSSRLRSHATSSGIGTDTA